MDDSQVVMLTGEIMNAGWWVRNQRATQTGRARREQAYVRMAGAVRRALELELPAEPVLFAVAMALYDRRDPRFQT